MIEVFTPSDSGPTAIDPHSLSNTVYMNKSRGTPSPMFQCFNTHRSVMPAIAPIKPRQRRRQPRDCYLSFS